MRIALDGRTIQDHFPGIGRYTFNLALALAESGPANDILLLHNQRDRNTRFELDLLRAQPNLSILESNAPYFLRSSSGVFPDSCATTNARCTTHPTI